MKASTLRQHGIKTVILQNGVILADNEDGTFTNVTNMSNKAFYSFLGY